MNLCQGVKIEARYPKIQPKFELDFLSCQRQSFDAALTPKTLILYLHDLQGIKYRLFPPTVSYTTIAGTLSKQKLIVVTLRALFLSQPANTNTPMKCLA